MVESLYYEWYFSELRVAEIFFGGIRSWFEDVQSV